MQSVAFAGTFWRSGGRTDRLIRRRCCGHARTRTKWDRVSSSVMPVRDVKMTNGVSTAATEKFPAYIPQTMEWALSQAQSALAAALSDDLRRIIVELPMGRTRKFWTRQAPRDSWLRETAVLASHITHFVEGADIRVVLGEKCPPSTCVEPWISERHILKSSMTADFLGSTLPADSLGATSESTIVFAVGVLNNQQTALRKMIETIPESVPLVLFNCFMDVPMDSKLFPPEFVPTYMCRSLKRCAFARYGHRAPYHVFVEIAIFEYEWIGDVTEHTSSFTPDQKQIENIAFNRGAQPLGGEGFYKSDHRGCEAGFWPFMSLAARYVLPLTGENYRAASSPQGKKRKASTSSKPFGFF